MMPTSRKLLATVALGALAASTIAVSISGAQTGSDGEPTRSEATRSEATRSEATRSDVSRRESRAVGATTDVALLESVLDEDDQDFDLEVLEDFAANFGADCDFDFDFDFDFDLWEPTPEEITEFNQWAAEEKAALDAAGIDNTLETDEFGVQYVEWAEADDEAAWTALESTWADEWGDTDWGDTDWGDTDWGDTDWDDADFSDLHGFDVEEWDPTPEEIAEINEWASEEIAALEAAGVAITVETDEYGIRFADWSEADDEAAIAALDAIWDEWDDFESTECDVELDDDAFITS